MITRQLQHWLEHVADRPQVIHVYGLRQTGKTTLMNAFRSRYPQALHYPLFDLVTLRKYAGSPEKWVFEIESALQKRPNQILHVFVDEIQKIPELFQGIQGLYDQLKGKIKFWIWGSSARPLKRQRAETLAGRSLSKILWPFSQSELLNKASCVPHLFEPAQLAQALEVEEPRHYAEFLKRWLQQTMLPEPNQLEELLPAQELLSSYQATYLENEIRRENLAQDIGTFEQFLSLAASEDTHIANHAAKARALGISPHTLKSYYGILEDTFVCCHVPAYSKSLRVQTRKSPKIYFTDTGLAKSIAGELGLPNENSRSFGNFIEGFVVNEIFKQIEYHSLPWKISYLRTKSGMEVDLILSRGSQKIAAEIKSAKKIIPRDYQPILELMRMDREIQYGIVFSRQAAPLKLEKNIYNFPIWNL